MFIAVLRLLLAYFVGMKTPMTALLVVLLLSACACDSTAPGGGKPERFRITIDSVGQPYGPGTDFIVKVWIRPQAGWQGVAQEVAVDCPVLGHATVTEAWVFQGMNVLQSDVHSIKPGGVHTMRMYLADFDGLVCDQWGYAQIAGTPPGMISGHHHAAHGYAGTITRTGREVVWSIEGFDSGVRVTVEGAEHWFPV